ncbi:MAG: protein kinase [Planctomycetota bacterium]
MHLRLGSGPASAVRAELATLAVLRHPGLAVPADHGPLPGGGWYVARPWIEGMDLRSWARDRSAEEIGRAVARIAPPLAHLHGAGFVHGDLKPENVLVAATGEVVLADLGLARPAGQLREEPGVAGTLVALAPEILLGLSPTPASDLFALGALLVQLLVGRRPSPREFYAFFPARSFLDAAGVSFALAETASEPPLAWRALFGREVWARRWLAATSRPDASSAQWLRLPAAEDPRALWEELRLRAALAGIPGRGVDLASGPADPARSDLDRWSAGLVAGAGALLVLAGRPGPAAHRSIEVLVRAAERSLPRPPIVVFAAGAAPERGWEVHDVPSPTAADITRCLGGEMPGLESADLERLASALHGAAQGSATALDRLLAAARREGILAWDGTAWRLFAGALGRLAGGSPPTLAEGPAPGGEDGERLVAALAVTGEAAPAGEIAELVELPPARFARALFALEGWRPPPRIARGLHARLATLRAGAGAPPAAILPHRLAADPSPANLARWREHLDELAEAGRAEIALEIALSTEAHLERLGLDVAGELPEVPAEVAGAWSQLGQPDQALARLPALERAAGPRPPALSALVRARVAVLRHRPEEALVLYADASALDPSVRAQLLYTLGRDRELLALGEEIAARALDHPPLSHRRLLHVRSLVAMASFRLGDVEGSRRALAAVQAEAGALGEPALEIALAIDVATVERRSGSLARARSELERALRLAEEHGLSAALAYVRETLGSVRRDAGEMASAAELLADSLAARERLGDEDGAARVRGVLALLRAERGHAVAARKALAESLERLGPAWRRRYGPLLRAKRVELDARLGRPEDETEAFTPDEESDPRVLLSLARAAWLRGHPARARELAGRAEGLARSLRQEQMVVEAALVGRWIDGDLAALPPGEPGPLLAQDRDCLALLRETGSRFDAEGATVLAGRLAAAGRDDRAARIWLALAGRVADDARAGEHLARAEALLAACAAGATAAETAALRRHLFGGPDPWPGDLSPAPRHSARPEVAAADVAALLDINRRLLAQQDSAGLLGAIVDSAIAVTGAERGFFVLEEHGVLRFDIALDSSRGGSRPPSSRCPARSSRRPSAA